MPRVVPSQVVAFIDELTFPEIVKGTTRVNSVGSAALHSVLDLVEQVPDELQVMDGATYASFVAAKADIRDLLEIWNADRTAGNKLREIRWNTTRNPVTIIQNALVKCPDESPAPSTSELSFISDPDLRANLRADMGAINRALSNGEWKAATVLAGSAIEALLLWDLQNRRQTTFPAAVSALVANKTFDKPPSSDPEEWSLHHYVEVEAYLGIIKSDTATEARLAKQFRNLIHPGRAQRLGQKCDRGTALSSVAALEHVVRDLT